MTELPPADNSDRVQLSGWGRTSPTSASLVHPGTDQQVNDIFDQHLARGVIARGLGRSYGDAAQNAGGVVAEMTHLKSMHYVDVENSTVNVDAGVSLDELMRLLIPMGLFPAVTPGTRQVTVGGAIAADIHGKNHHADGTFCNHVQSFTLKSPAGEQVVSPTQNPDVFWATAGGMGLTGCITSATLSLLPIETAYMRVHTNRVNNLDDLLNLMESEDHLYRYSVAWLDCLARGSHLGRSVLMRGDHARLDDLPRKLQADPLSFSPSSQIGVPRQIPSGLLNKVTAKAFNEVWFRKAPKNHTGTETIGKFFHPLDTARNWNRLYGPSGFLQYQFVVPLAADHTLREILDRLSKHQCPAFLAVLKRFGAANGGPTLSFPAPGWTLALDMPANLNGLGPLLDDLDSLVADAGGRIYLAKDSRAKPETIRQMYRTLPEWQKVRKRLDPEGILCSDLSRRLELLEPIEPIPEGEFS